MMIIDVYLTNHKHYQSTLQSMSVNILKLKQMALMIYFLFLTIVTTVSFISCQLFDMVTNRLVMLDCQIKTKVMYQ